MVFPARCIETNLHVNAKGSSIRVDTIKRTSWSACNDSLLLIFIDNIWNYFSYLQFPIFCGNILVRSKGVDKLTVLLWIWGKALHHIHKVRKRKDEQNKFMTLQWKLWTCIFQIWNLRTNIFGTNILGPTNERTDGWTHKVIFRSGSPI